MALLFPMHADLLGLKEAPRTVCIPTLQELAQHPFSKHAELVRKAMRNAGPGS